MVNRSYNGKRGELRKVFVLDKKYRWCDCSHSCKLETMVNDGKKIYAADLLSSIYSKNFRDTGKPRYEYFKENIS